MFPHAFFADYDPEDAYNAVESNGPADQDLALGLDEAGREHYVEVGFVVIMWRTTPRAPDRPCLPVESHR